MIIAVERATDTAEARRQAAELARQLGFDAERTGRVSIVATELATNVLKHAGKGELLVQHYDAGRDVAGVEMIAIDRGPGIADLARARADGFSTAGSRGTGLGAIQRIADLVSVFTQPGQGTVALARVARPDLPAAASAAATSFESGSVVAVCPGEAVAGDACAVLPIRDGLWRLMVVDGSGHGAAAAAAAVAAHTLFEAHPALGLADLLALMHRGLGHTRGAAVAIAEIDREARLVHFAGLGNIAGTLSSPEKRHGMVSANGTLGHTWRTVKQFDYPFDGGGATVVMHSDGIGTRWRLDGYPGLGACHPSVIAAVLYRDFRRTRDDASTLVAKVRP